MNVLGQQASQQNLFPIASDPQRTVPELPIDFKMNGFWHVQGVRKAGTLRRKGNSQPSAYFLVTHSANEPPFTEPTDARLETHDGSVITGSVMKYTNRKDAGEAGICSEYNPDGERCRQRRFWKTFCRDHTRAEGFEITDDGRICAGIKGNGAACTFRAKVDGYCAQHGGGSAPLENKTYLYEFPIDIFDMGGI